MSKKAPAVLIVIGLLLSGSAAYAESAPEARVKLGAVIKVLATSRERNQLTGVKPIEAAGLRWVELSVSGSAGERAVYAIELVANQNLYQDPVTGQGATVRGGPNEMGALGVRRAELKIGGLPLNGAVRVGLFMPGWGLQQDISAGEWRFVDLPLIYTNPAFHALGWQNSGLALSLAPLESLELQGFWVNGYFPNAPANREAPLPLGGLDHEKAYGGRVKLRLGPALLFAGYYRENWQEDLRRGPRPEMQSAQAWIAGGLVSTPKLWVMLEWMNLIAENDQLKNDGSWTDLQSLGGHLTAGWLFVENWEALLRYEWIDPNTANTRHTFNRSRFDQITQWTVGVNYRLNPGATVMADYVMPFEEGHQADTNRGRTGGKYQRLENNYFHLQFQLAI